MEENLQTQQTTNTPTPTADAAPMPSTSGDYATFWQRLAAALIDGVLISLVLGTLFGTNSYGEGGISIGYSGSLPSLIGLVYYVLMVTKFGATLGKMALKIKVQSISTGQNPTLVEAILREVVGKFISAIVILVGYFWMLWDPQKQTWHDKIAKTVVVKA